MISASDSGWKAVLSRLAGWLRPAGLFSQRPSSETAAFTMAVVGLAAKMAKADGVAVAVEAQAFERCFRVPPDEMLNARRLFDLAARDVAGFDAYAARIAGMLRNDRARLKQVLECLFHIATADHMIHAAEAEFLAQVAHIFGMSDDELLAVRAMFVHDPDSPYAVLGVSPDLPNAELRAHYLRLVKEGHPDRLTAAGAPRELIAVADRKLAAINAAYEQIVAGRTAVAAGERR